MQLINFFPEERTTPVKFPLELILKVNAFRISEGLAEHLGYWIRSNSIDFVVSSIPRKESYFTSTKRRLTYDEYFTFCLLQHIPSTVNKVSSIEGTFVEYTFRSRKTDDVFSLVLTQWCLHNNNAIYGHIHIHMSPCSFCFLEYVGRIYLESDSQKQFESLCVPVCAWICM